ncbi:hypothetical protein [Streptomyces sp. YIM B13502]
MREVSGLEWPIDTMPNVPLIDTRWPLCECYLLPGQRFPRPPVMA